MSCASTMTGQRLKNKNVQTQTGSSFSSSQKCFWKSDSYLKRSLALKRAGFFFFIAPQALTQGGFAIFGENSCLLGRSSCLLGRRFCLLGRRFCLLGRRFCLFGRRFCLLGRSLDQLGRRSNLIGRNSILRGRNPNLFGSSHFYFIPNSRVLSQIIK